MSETLPISSALRSQSEMCDQSHECANYRKRTKFDKWSFGLSGHFAAFANVSAVGVLVWLVVYQMPVQQARFDATLDKVQASNERVNDKLAAAIDRLSDRLGRGRGAIGDSE